MRQVAILKVKVGFLGEISVSVWRALSNDFICHSMHRVYYVHEVSSLPWPMSVLAHRLDGLSSLYYAAAVRGRSHPSHSRYSLLPERRRPSCMRADDARPLAGQWHWQSRA